MKAPSSIRILGVDPGFGRTGLGVVDMSGGNGTYVWHETIESSKDQEFSDRLQIIRNDLNEAIRRFQPQAACVESLFFQNNARTAMKVGMARGVMLLALADAKIPLIEITPNQLKQGITGFGGADKKQVEFMVKRLLKIPPGVKILDDAYDALALAMVGGLLVRTAAISRGNKA